jgi:hypothetical protein
LDGSALRREAVSELGCVNKTTVLAVADSLVVVSCQPYFILEAIWKEHKKARPTFLFSSTSKKRLDPSPNPFEYLDFSLL